ncbi:MAG: hypothetical protein Q4G33_11810 [bacterium]|nr:hypothetical protein [bacterium]
MLKLSCVLATAAISTAFCFSGCTQEKEKIVIHGIMPELTESELILNSDLIISGSVSEILNSKWSNENLEKGENIPNILQTDIIIDVDEVIEGDCINNYVTVRINKGENEDTVVYSEGYPDFTEGEQVLLFLARDDSGLATDEDYYVLTGMKQGKYSLKENNTDVYSNDVKAEASYVNDKNTIDIDTLQSAIEKENEANPDYKTEKSIRQEEIKKENEELFGE